MAEIERYEGFILDNEQLLVINPVSSEILYFNFEEMWFRKGSHKTKRPIRYMDESKTLRYWGEQKWQNFSTHYRPAINKLFDNNFERQLLGES